jgi:AcrR family transcriptional regulator
MDSHASKEGRMPQTTRSEGAEHEGDRTPRARILEGAAELFSQQGIRAVGVDTIVARAGVAKATLYHHFPTKDDLIVEWLRTTADWLVWVRPEVERRTSDPLMRLVTIFDVFDEWFRSGNFQGCPYERCASEFREAEHPVREEVRSFMAKVRAWLRELLGAGGLTAPDELASQIHVLMAGALILADMLSSPAPAASARATALDIISEELGLSRDQLEQRIRSGGSLRS